MLRRVGGLGRPAARQLGRCKVGERLHSERPKRRSWVWWCRNRDNSRASFAILGQPPESLFWLNLLNVLRLRPYCVGCRRLLVVGLAVLRVHLCVRREFDHKRGPHVVDGPDPHELRLQAADLALLLNELVLDALPPGQLLRKLLLQLAHLPLLLDDLRLLSLLPCEVAVLYVQLQLAELTLLLYHLLLRVHATLELVSQLLLELMDLIVLLHKLALCFVSPVLLLGQPLLDLMDRPMVLVGRVTLRRRGLGECLLGLPKLPVLVQEPVLDLHALRNLFGELQLELPDHLGHLGICRWLHLGRRLARGLQRLLKGDALLAQVPDHQVLLLDALHGAPEEALLLGELLPELGNRLPPLGLGLLARLAQRLFRNLRAVPLACHGEEKLGHLLLGAVGLLREGHLHA
mmetsp:Transcript_46980/g.140268  ORF Transcript_46980/g.140268 Transcript_46980/m.140268 type:complete len:404 (-) Transcript_46980:160-1371(-)